MIDKTALRLAGLRQCDGCRVSYAELSSEAFGCDALWIGKRPLLLAQVGPLLSFYQPIFLRSIDQDRVARARVIEFRLIL